MHNAVLKKAIVKVLGIAGITTVTSSLQAASFDCAKAGTTIEKMICESPAISNFDEQLATVYKTAIEKAADKDVLKQQQRVWLKEKRNTCKDEDCLSTVYRQRLVELNNLPAGASSVAMIVKPEPKVVVIPADKRIENQKLPLTFKLVEGDSYPICQPYVDMLNKTKYMEYPVCERKLLPEFKQFKSIEWTEITDKKEVEKIMGQLVRLDVVRDNEIDSPHHQRVWKRTKERIYSGNSRYYFSKFDFEKDGEYEIVYKETVKYPRRQKNSLCKYENFYDVEDKKLTVEKIVKHSIDPYMMLKGLHAHLFIFNEKVINSIWQPYGNNYSIELWTSNSHPALCKINIE